ncbi:MAG: hypothetical protein QM765_38785 [Myxococcales bacterium]
MEQGLLTGEARRFERFEEAREDLAAVGEARGSESHGVREVDQVAKSILQVEELGFADEPKEVEVRIGEEDPRQSFGESRFDIRRSEGPEEQSGGVLGARVRLEVAEGVVAQGRDSGERRSRC